MDIEKVSVSKTEYERYKKWAYGITLKEFVTECTKLGILIDQYNYKWDLKFKGCHIATIDPLDECTMQTSDLFYKLQFKYELFELLTNLAYTCREDRHIEDYFEEWQYEEWY